MRLKDPKIVEKLFGSDSSARSEARGNPHIQASAETILRGAHPDAGTVAQEIGLVEYVEDGEARLDVAGARLVPVVGDTQIRHGVVRQTGPIRRAAVERATHPAAVEHISADLAIAEF